MRILITRLYLFSCVIAGPVMADVPDPHPLIDDEISVKLELLDKISYHPNLLPIILGNSDYLELTPEQIKLFSQWRKDNFQPMFDAMAEIVKGRADFIEASLDAGISGNQLQAHQKKLFALQEEVLAYKLSCRKNLISTFSTEQWDSLQFMMNDVQLPGVD
jgi:hypothetical protein